MIIDLPLADVFTRTDGRALNESAVEGLAESIASIGLLNPIRVRQTGEKWEVIAGAHRVAACRKLGLAEIQAIAADADDLHAELAMIDENLMRAELSPSERAEQTARRKAIYLELHPETAHGGDRKSDQVAKLSTRSFDAETAAATSQSERSVRRDAERGEKVIAAAIAIIKGTALDTGTYLDKLKKLSPSEQVVAAKRDLAWHRQQQRDASKKGIARRIKIADAPITDEEAREKQVAALMAAWNKASAEARQEFLERIDTPVFDHSSHGASPVSSATDSRAERSSPPLGTNSRQATT